MLKLLVPIAALALVIYLWRQLNDDNDNFDNFNNI